jgi:hypothetical protein
MTTTTSPWTGKVWKLRTMTLSIEPLMLSDTAENNNFKLQEVHDASGKLACYRVDFVANTMADCWKDCFVFPRGNKPVPPLTIPLSANPTTPELQNAALATQGAVNLVRFSTERLECDITVPGRVPMLGSLSLYQIQGAIGGQKSLLVVSFRADGNPGGTGGGGSDHT